jgi:hypothetical protein
MVNFANVSQDSIMNASTVTSPVTDALSTIDAYARPEVVGHDQYPESLTARRMMNVSVIHGRTHSRLVNRRQGNSGTRNGSIVIRANQAVIMNEIRWILQVFRQGIDVQRLTEDVSKLRAAGMV